jgi:ABC-type Fe3+-hydroxamate transport system substrate-binding protein
LITKNIEFYRSERQRVLKGQVNLVASCFTTGIENTSKDRRSQTRKIWKIVDHQEKEERLLNFIKDHEDEDY